MNILLHFLINYTLIDLIFANANDYWLIILIASTIVDLDHLPYFFRNKTKGRLAKMFDFRARSILHEPISLAVLGIIFISISGSVDSTALNIAFLCYALHIMADILAGTSRPLFPFSKKERKLFGLSTKKRIFLEAGLTSVLCIVLVF